MVRSALFALALLGGFGCLIASAILESGLMALLTLACSITLVYGTTAIWRKTFEIGGWAKQFLWSFLVFGLTLVIMAWVGTLDSGTNAWKVLLVGFVVSLGIAGVSLVRGALKLAEPSDQAVSNPTTTIPGKIE